MGENALMGGGMSPADVRAVMGNDGDWGGNGAWWIVVLFALMFGGNGFGWGNRGYQPQCATQDFVQNGFNFNDLQDQNRDLMAAVTSGTAQSVAASNQAKYDAIYALKDAQTALNAQLNDIRQMEQSIISNQQECCCSQLRAIDSVNYNNAMNTAALQQAIAAEGQATRTMLQNDKIEALQQQLNATNQALNTQALMNEIQAATAGVVRYPDSFAYNAGNNPFCGCGQPMGCCNI